MTESVDYGYARGDLLGQPNTYFYSAFQGKGFIDAWERSRAECLKNCLSAISFEGDIVKAGFEETFSPTGIYLDELKAFFSAADIPSEERKNLDAILRNFEAKKRIYQDYNPGFTSKDRSDYREIGLYVSFAELMVLSYEKWQELPYLNALIKCMDILCAHCADLQDSEKIRMCSLIDAEAKCVGQLSQRLGVNKS